MSLKDHTSPLVDFATRIEGDKRIDGLADAIAPVADELVADSQSRDLLQGAWLGHSVHPLLTDLPIGAWTSANMLDLFGGATSRPAARKLIFVGLLTAVPTVLTGLAEYSTTSGGDRRVGVVHALANGTAFGLFAASWQARRKERHKLGATLALAGTSVATVGRYLGGHLAIARKVGTGLR
jgi:uncharacterized membrane protein